MQHYKKSTSAMAVMKRVSKKTLSVILPVLMTLTLLPFFAFADSGAQTTIGGKTVEELQTHINDLYSDETIGTTGRLHRMQAFILELALHAKLKNPDFKIIPQDGIDLAFKDGVSANGVDEGILSLVDGWGIEGMVGNGPLTTPTTTQQKYIALKQAGIYVSDTTVVNTQQQLDNYYARANAWGIIPYPRIGGELAQSLFPGWRWAVNGDYFWVENPTTIGLSSRIDGTRNVNNLTDAKNYLYNINSRPYDAWDKWDAEEAAVVAEGGEGDRARIYDSYGSGLLVPSVGGQYKPVAGEDGDPTDIDGVKALYGDEWDWWWRQAGLNVNDGRKTWLEALRNSDYDVIYIDSFYNHRAFPENQTPLTKEEIDSLKVKSDGGRRQVIAYLSIGSAEQNRWYAQDEWTMADPNNPNTPRSMKAGTTTGSGASRVYTPAEEGTPTWLAFGYGGNYTEEAIVQWWDPAWRDIIINGDGQYNHKTTGDNTSSIDRIINQGFDGVYLDNVGVYSNSRWPSWETYWTANGGIPGGSVLSKFTFTYNGADVIDGSVPNTENDVWSADTSVLPNHTNTIPVPKLNLPTGMMANWVVTASQDPAYKVGDVIVNPSSIIAWKGITFKLRLVNIEGVSLSTKAIVRHDGGTLNVAVKTNNAVDLTAVSAELVDSNGNSLNPAISASGEIVSDSAILGLQLPFHLPVGTYTVKVTLGNNELQDMSQTFKVNLKPMSFALIPKNQNVNIGDMVTFSAKAAYGDENYTYQWQQLVKGAWTDIANTNSGDYTVKAALSLDNTTYRCVIKDTSGNSITSKEVTLKVKKK
ncbi:hypothetical protein [Neobacillus sp. FSL H8-0543]|uniref:hypothetical protein n=1 Tax=Neobacillus sp. FSL H8-0543 TaxID=2954672 RepID=UPI00315984F9